MKTLLLALALLAGCAVPVDPTESIALAVAPGLSTEATHTDAPGTVSTGVCFDNSAMCATVNAHDADVRRDFPPSRYACDEGEHACAGTGVSPVYTYPVDCKLGSWRLSGSMASGSWVPGHTCSHGCLSHEICTL